MPRDSVFSHRKLSLSAGLRQRQASGWACALVAGCFLGAAPAEAETFKGTEIKGASGIYLVTKDVIVRDKPANQGGRAGSLKEGERIEVFGRTTGNWLAVKKGDKRLGFVYAPVLMPLIDGAIDKDVTGKAAIGRGAHCMFTIHFEGRSEIEGELLQTADYDVAYRCENEGKKFTFNGPMFITEAPYQASSKPVYQVSVDLLDIAEDPDHVFSTVVFYDRDAGEVKLDSVSPPEFAGKATLTRKPAATVAQALAGAVEIALAAWGDRVWDTLTKAGR